LLAAALALLLVVDILSAPLAMVIITQGGALSHRDGWLRASLFFLLVAAVLVWLTSVVVTALRKPASKPAA
jgi:hypothetical protein